MDIMYTTTDPIAVRSSFSMHFRRGMHFDLDGIHLGIIEADNADAVNLISKHPNITSILPYRNGTLSDQNVSELSKGAKIATQIKKGTTMRDALRVLHSVIGYEELHPDL